jgi:23S rRNA pseudouridine2605 synthase
MRLAKYLARCGVASRRHAERLVKDGRVLVDGNRVTDPAHPVGDGAEVRVDGSAVSAEPLEYYLVHKPKGVVSTAHDPEGRPKVTDLVRSRARLYPVGRLDVDSSGLLLLTNDGELANRLMHPRFEVDKTYRANVQGAVSERTLERLRSGVELEDGRTAPARVEVIGRDGDSTELELVIHEGRKRQVRRMCETLGHPVRSLVRTGFGPLRLEGLAPRGVRELEPGEIERLRAQGDRSAGS